MDAKTLTPAYYNDWQISPLQYIVANRLDFFRGNIIKYVMRYEGKNGKEDLEKAKWYLQYLIDHYEEMTTTERREGLINVK